MAMVEMGSRTVCLGHDVPERILSPRYAKGMPAILQPRDLTTWLDGWHDGALALVRPYGGPMIEQVATPVD